MTTKTSIQLTTSFTDTTLPKDRIDPVMPDTGALYLMDFAHPVNPSGFPALNVVPGDNAMLHNVAWSQAAAMIGSGDATSLALKVRRGAFTDPTIGKIERSTKGGLHVFTKKATDPGFTGSGVASAYGVNILDDNLLRGYLLAQPTHNFYFSVWGRITRASTAVSQTLFTEITSTTSSSGNYRAQISTSNGGGASIPSNGGGARLLGPSAGPVLGSLASSAWVGTAPGAATGLDLFAGLLGIGGLGQSSAAIRQGKADQIIYRVYCEDLTVSGRTYATVDALDFAQYSKDVLTAGGRFFGDTFTDPATLP